MQLSTVLLVSLLCLLAFTIGLYIGLHGLLSIPQDVRLFANNYESWNRSQIMHTNIITETELLPTDPIKFVNNIVLGQYNLNTTTDVVSEAHELSEVESSVDSIETKVSKILLSSKYQQFLRSKYEDSKLRKNHEITEYLSLQKEIPILLMTCNRPELLIETIKSLLSVKHVNTRNILASQDGSNTDVRSVLQRNSIQFVQNLEGINLLGGVPLDGAQRIARHYKFSISTIFKKYPDAPAIIIVEDDLLFSPDFYEYFVNTVPILEQDDSLFLISAWNDNGFKGKVHDPFSLHRTEFFPGLGWLLPRKLYESELERKWPLEHWDHWLRSYDIHKGREILYPEVPRTYHNGIKGTFMNIETHNKYFRDIDYNQNRDITWPEQSAYDNRIQPYISAQKDAYEERIKLLIESCQHVSDMRLLAQTNGNPSRIDSSCLNIAYFAFSGILCVWIDVNPESEMQEFHPIAKFFGLWHEHKRGSHQGLHQFYWENRYILLFNIYHVPLLKNYESLKPQDVTIIPPSSFNRKTYIMYANNNNIRYDIFASSEAGISCDKVCKKFSKSCNEDYLQLVNNCNDLKKKFPCQECVDSIGAEQPAYVNPSASREHQPGKCLVNSKPEISECSASHHVTMRLCACI